MTHFIFDSLGARAKTKHVTFDITKVTRRNVACHSDHETGWTGVPADWGDRSWLGIVADEREENTKIFIYVQVSHGEVIPCVLSVDWIDDTRAQLEYNGARRAPTAKLNHRWIASCLAGWYNSQPWSFVASYTVQAKSRKIDS